jgi:hypothetical protein
MIQISINTATGSASLANNTTIKAGGLVPVKITFSEDPGTLPLLELALSPESSSPTILAYLEEFQRQNPTTFTGWLNSNDSRLLDFLSGKTSAAIVCEVACTVSGDRRNYPNLKLTVQPPVITGPASSEGGPFYYTVEQVQALLDAVLAAATIEINEVTTLEAGASVTVVNIGTPQKAIWNIGIPVGAPGVDGRTIIYREGAPDNGLDGADGDLCLDTVNHKIYGPKTDGVWGSGVSLVGPTGPIGPIGPLNEFRHAALSGTSIDWALDSMYYKSISTNTTFTWANLANGKTILVDLTTSSGAVPTWPDGIVWANGITPTHPTNGNAIYTFVRINGTVKGAMQPF